MDKQTILILDYGMGNTGSIFNMVEKVGGKAVVSADKKLIEEAKKIILPGVGSFDKGIENLEKLNLIPLLNQKIIADKTPVLGICLGMQLMTKRSEEGLKNGLGWVDAETIKFKFTNNDLKIPHMGWNLIKIEKKSTLFENMMTQENRFYFVHSYFVSCNNQEDSLSTANYGFVFTSAFEKNNIYGVQFHPEKSHKFGMQLIKNFLGI